MKTPSRYMPKREGSGEAGIGTYLFLIGIALLPAALILINAQSKFAYILLICFYVSIISFGYIAGFISDRHFKKLFIGRERDSICTFTRFFDFRNVDTWIIRAVYEEIQFFIGEQVPIRPRDNIYDDLKIDPDDFEMDHKFDIVGNIADRTGRSLDGYEQNPYYGKVNTVEDLVMFFNLQPKLKTT